ncbi:MAG: glycoside hydrolase family 65 protein [Planctomycetota bacterium]|jgi:alpha,alpha-trehalose phosphorylase
MIHQERIKYPEHVYPTDEWRLVEKRFYPKYLAQMETLFATSNGYLGMRGNFEEGRPAFHNGTIINGFYESWPIIYGEEAYGYAKMGQTALNVPDGKVIKLYVDDEPFFLPTADLLRYERSLDMRSGVLSRDILWEIPAGKRVSIQSKRIVSLEHRHLAAIVYEVTVENAHAPVIISSKMLNRQIKHEDEVEDDDPRRAPTFRGQVLLPQNRAARDHRVVLSYTTRSSRMTLACGMEHQVETECPYSFESDITEDSGKVVYAIEAQPGKPFRLIKYLSYHSSRSAPPKELCDRVDRTLTRAVGDGFDRLQAGQKNCMDEFWKRSDVEVHGDPAMQQALRFNLFHIHQATSRTEGAGVPAKGLTGLGYEGHYFWDMETYLLPFLIYTSPQVARNLLRFRYSMLDKARERARQVNQKGALFPWRTINGEEASAYYAAGTAQYHINADIMYAMRKYVDVTGDEEFLYKYGAEMLVETARLWLDLGFFSESKGGKFCIHHVTGPDEYNAVVDNNTFTNLMARENLWFAAATARKLRDEHEKHFEVLVHRTGLDMAEVKAWQKAADNMYVPYDEKTGIFPQDDDFLEKEPWDFENTPPEKYPLLLHYHPLVIYRHNAIKQADVVLALFLLGNEFSLEEKKRNFDYYDAITTGDSSLSVSIQSILAFEIGTREKASEYARHSMLMDLADIGGNVRDGVHMASMGGTWMALVYGFAGMRDHDGRITFQPLKPKQIDGGSLKLTVRGQLLEVSFDRDSVTYTLKEGEGLTFRHFDEEIRLTRKEPIARRKPELG